MRVALLLLLIATAACPGGGARGGGGAGGGPALTIPVTAGAAAELDRLDAAAGRGDRSAAWTRAHYLIDLFDDARFRRADDSLELLRRALRLPETVPRRGPRATEEVIARLLIEVDRVLRLDRRHAGAQAARTLLEIDGKPPATRAQLRQQVIELKAVAGALVDNARLRLHGICRQALGDALKLRWAQRAQAIAYCLYPLYGADPEPYFDADPLRRPPAPRWRELTATLAELAGQVASGPGRLAPAGRHARAELQTFLAASAAELPEPIEPAALRLPRAAHAPAYDGTPVIVIRAGEPVASAQDYAALVDAQLQGDGRETVALAIGEGAALEAFLRAGAGAAQAGARWIELVYGLPQTLTVPAGDYWHGRLDGGALIPGALPVALSTEAPPARSDPRRAPHAPRWEPERARLGLHLVIEKEAWRLVAPDGEVALITTTGRGGDRGTELRESLARARDAFAGETGLVIVPAAGASFASLAEAIQLAARDAAGRPLFDRLALGTAPPRAAGVQTLVQRIERRRRARVTIEPTALQSRVPALRACYQDLLEKRPDLAGAVTVRAAGSTNGKPDPGLRACALAAVRESATITFAPR